MTLIARLRVMPRRHAVQRHALPSRSASPVRGGGLLLVWAAAASLGGLVAWQVLAHPLPDLSAFGCWSVPDDASACALGQGDAPILQDQILELGASVLPEHDGRAALSQQALWPRPSETVAGAHSTP